MKHNSLIFVNHGSITAIDLECISHQIIIRSNLMHKTLHILNKIFTFSQLRYMNTNNIKFCFRIPQRDGVKFHN